MNETPETNGGEVVLYQSPDGEVRLDVRLDHESVWLTQKQMAELFDTSPDNVGLHLKNVYAEGELVEGATTEDSSVVQTEGKRRVRRSVKHYSLDAVISVGYRVNSARGTQFRIWATRTLREHLLRGYTLSETRLREKGFGEIEQAVSLLANTLTRHDLVSGEGAAVLDVVQHYTRAWRLLLEYDEGRLPEAPPRPESEAFRLTLPVAGALIADLRTALAGRGQAGSRFGQEYGGRLSAILGAIEQTFDGRPLCPSLNCAPRICCISSSRITRSPTATSASGRCCSWSTSPGTSSLHAPTALSVSPTTRWSLWRSSSLRASRGRETSWSALS